MVEQELQVQQKREVERKQETTIPARAFLPATDIFETDQSLTVVLEMPGVNKDSVDVGPVVLPDHLGGIALADLAPHALQLARTKRVAALDRRGRVVIALLQRPRHLATQDPTAAAEVEEVEIVR